MEQQQQAGGLNFEPGNFTMSSPFRASRGGKLPRSSNRARDERIPQGFFGRQPPRRSGSSPIRGNNSAKQFCHEQYGSQRRILDGKARVHKRPSGQFRPPLMIRRPDRNF